VLFNARLIMTEPSLLSQTSSLENVEYNKYRYIPISLFAIPHTPQNMGRLHICMEVL
jgi:hypothetical protein